jgi:DNA-binding NarL/FixJ family response regulator
MIRILLADDHEIVRKGVRRMLEDQDGWVVCAEATNGREAVEMAAQHRPAVAVLDLSMPELNGFEATRQIRRESPQTEVLIFTMHDTENLIWKVLSAGARGFVLKSDVSEHLISAVTSLSRHRPYFTDRVSEALLEAFLKTKLEDCDNGAVTSVLSPREREILQLVAEGRSNKEIAARLVISIKTVETHRAAIMRKLGVNSVVDLVHYAIRNELVAA